MELAKVWIPQAPGRGIGCRIGVEAAVPCVFERVLSSLLGAPGVSDTRMDPADALEADDSAITEVADVEDDGEGGSPPPMPATPGIVPALLVVPTPEPDLLPSQPAAFEIPPTADLPVQAVESVPTDAGQLSKVLAVAWGPSGVAITGGTRHGAPVEGRERACGLRASERQPSPAASDSRSFAGTGPAEPEESPTLASRPGAGSVGVQEPLRANWHPPAALRPAAVQAGSGSEEPKMFDVDCRGSGCLPAADLVIQVEGGKKAQGPSGGAEDIRFLSERVSDGVVAAPAPRSVAVETDRAPDLGDPPGEAAFLEFPLREANVAAGETDAGPPVLASPGPRSLPSDPARRSSPAVNRHRAERLWGYWARRGPWPAESLGQKSAPAKGEDAAGVSVPEGGLKAKHPALWALESVPAEATAAQPPESRVATSDPVRVDASPSPGSAEIQAEEGRAAGTPRPPSHGAMPPPPAYQIARAIRISLAREGDRITVQLQPEKLGRVQLVVTRMDKELAALFRVETPEAHQALTAEAPALRQALEARGVSIAHVWVDLEGSAGDRGGGPPLGRRGARRASPPAAREEESPSDAPMISWRSWGFDTRV